MKRFTERWGVPALSIAALVSIGAGVGIVWGAGYSLLAVGAILLVELKLSGK